MVVELVNLIRESIPPIDSENAPDRISIYGAHERVYINLTQRSFLSIPENLVKYSDYELIARNVFDDVYFKIRKASRDFHWSVMFNHEGRWLRENFFYEKKYDHKSIEVHDNLCHPYITFDFLRGDNAMVPRQREKFLKFLTESYAMLESKVPKP